MPDEPQHPFDSLPVLWEMLKPLARQKRHQPTRAENALWQRLRNKQLCGAKFRRQYAIERFIVDFCCLEAHLIIEDDGEIHQYTAVEDEVRQQFLTDRGFAVLRLTNEDVVRHQDEAVERISAALVHRLEQID